MRPLQRVVWSQGMMMSPQHFQQQDLYHEALLDERIRGLTDFAWGVISLELDPRALDAGQVALRNFEGVFPSGSVLRFVQGDEEAPATRSIEGHFPAHREVLEIFLGVPVERMGSSAYARSDSEKGRARYVIETRATLDAVSPSEEDSVDFARRNVALLFGDEPRDDVECIKIAEVVRDASGKHSYAGPFCPPALRIGASTFIQDGVHRVLAAVVARRRAVAEERRHRDATSVEYGSEDVTRYLALSALSGAIPVIKHLSESSDASPHRTYLTLVQLAGQLTAFSPEEDPSNLPAYHHADPRQTFEPLFAKLISLLRVAVADRVITVPLESRADGTHLGRLSDPSLAKAGVRFVLSIRAPLPEHQMYELVPRVAKLASWQDIPRLVMSATAGVSLVPAPRPPREIAVRTGKFYFLVPPDHPLWQGVMAQRAVALHLPPPFDPRTTSVELLAIPTE
jgi:type VI secretion system protein ImpJ